MEIIDKLKLLEEILAKINSSVSPDEVLNYLIDRCIELTEALTGSIMLINPETDVLEIKTYRGLQPEKVALTNLRVGEGVTGHVAQTGKPLLIKNTDEVSYYIRIRDDLKSELAVPLKLGNRTVGVISVDSNKRSNFSEEHLDILQTIANFAVQVLQKANLIADLKDKIAKQNLLLEIAGILEKSIELSTTFEKIMELVSQNIHISRGMLVLLKKDERLKGYTGYRLSKEAVRRGIYQIGEGIIGKVFKYGQYIALKDISQNKDFLNKMRIWRGKGERYSFFAVPIKYENRTVGVFSIEKKYSSEEDFNATLEVIILIATLVSNRVHSYLKSQRERNKILKKTQELRDRLEEKQRGLLFIGKSKKILEVMDMVNVIADTEATVLITGSTGTGKEILSRLIHNKSRRWEEPFISINCAAIPENLLESELFGYKKGSFTGAVKDKKGKFALAEGGSIFLDEIGDLSLNLQAKLLRVLQEKIIEPLGSEKSINIDVRIISATNKNLSELVKNKLFREDLFYRLNVINLELPSLAERKDDIPLFIDHFIRAFNEKYNKNIQDVTQECLELLINNNWPGNIRELQNVIERAVLLCHSNVVDIKNLPSELRSEIQVNENQEPFKRLLERELSNLEQGDVYKKIIQRVEKYLIDYALIRFNNKQIDAAKYLGIHRNSLYNKINSFKL